MNSTEIDGAELFELDDPQKRRLILQSTDRNRLAVVSDWRDGLFCVQLFRRTKEPDYGGPFWGRESDPSITDSLDAAERLARARLHLEER